MSAQPQSGAARCRTDRPTKRDPREEALFLSRREKLARLAYAYRIFPVSGIDGATLAAGGLRLQVPAFVSVPGRITAVAAAACTLGPALGARVTALFAERRPRLALALDALGSEMLFRLADGVQGRIAREARKDDLDAGTEISPGDPGMEIDQQANVLVLADAARTGIAITSGGMLAPAMSLTFVIALGRDLPASRPLARCQRCPSNLRCTIRRH